MTRAAERHSRHMYRYAYLELEDDRLLLVILCSGAHQQRLRVGLAVVKHAHRSLEGGVGVHAVVDLLGQVGRVDDGDLEARIGIGRLAGLAVDELQAHRGSAAGLEEVVFDVFRLEMAVLLAAAVLAVGADGARCLGTAHVSVNQTMCCGNVWHSTAYLQSWAKTSLYGASPLARLLRRVESAVCLPKMVSRVSPAVRCSATVSLILVEMGRLCRRAT